MLNVEVVTKENYRVFIGKSLPSVAVDRGDLYPNRKYFKLMSGMNDLDDIPGDKCLILGSEYIINNRHYDLESGFALVAKITPDFRIYPELRRAKGKEKGVIKDENGLGVLNCWPVLEDIHIEEQLTVEAPQIENKESFLEEAIQFKVDDECFSEYNFDSYLEEENKE